MSTLKIHHVNRRPVWALRLQIHMCTLTRAGQQSEKHDVPKLSHSVGILWHLQGEEWALQGKHHVSHKLCLLDEKPAFTWQQACMAAQNNNRLICNQARSEYDAGISLVHQCSRDACLHGKPSTQNNSCRQSACISSGASMCMAQASSCHSLPS